MQTAVRRLRKELNSSAREAGFSLSTAYQLDPSCVLLRMLKRGKAGDLAALASAARKKGDARMLKLLAARGADPDRAVPAASVQALQREWKPIAEEGELHDEMRALELRMQKSTVRATVDALRKKVPGRRDRAAVVACYLAQMELYILLTKILQVVHKVVVVTFFHIIAIHHLRRNIHQLA